MSAAQRNARFIGAVLTKLAEGKPLTLTAEESRLVGEAVLRRTTGRKLETIATKAKRNAMMFEAVQHFKPNATRAEQARWLHDELFQYQTRGAWRRDRELEQCPSRYLGKRTQWFWQISKLECPLPCWPFIAAILRDAASSEPPGG